MMEKCTGFIYGNIPDTVPHWKNFWFFCIQFSLKNKIKRRKKNVRISYPIKINHWPFIHIKETEFFNKKIDINNNKNKFVLSSIIV